MPTRQKSCDACVRSKRRCDKEYPHCSRCRARSVPCVYPRLPPSALLSGPAFPLASDDDECAKLLVKSPPGRVPELASSVPGFTLSGVPFPASGFVSSAEATDFTDTTDWSSASAQVSSAESSRRGSRATSPDREAWRQKMAVEQCEPVSATTTAATDSATLTTDFGVNAGHNVDIDWVVQMCHELQSPEFQSLKSHVHNQNQVHAHDQAHDQMRDAFPLQMDFGIDESFFTSQNLAAEMQLSWHSLEGGVDTSFNDENGPHSMLTPSVLDDSPWRDDFPFQWDATPTPYGDGDDAARHREKTPQANFHSQPQPQPQPQHTTPTHCILHNPDHHMLLLSAFLSRIPSSLATSHSASFIHPSLYLTPSATPLPIRACFTSCVLYTSRTPTNEDWVYAHLCAAVDELLSTDLPPPPRLMSTVLAAPEKPGVRRERDRLAATQALLVYLTIALDDEEVFKSTKVGAMADTLEKWAGELCVLRRGNSDGLESMTAVQIRAQPKSWNDWIRSESLQRTIIAAYAVLTQRVLLTSKSITRAVMYWAPGHRYTMSRYLWEAPDAENFYEAWDSLPHCVRRAGVFPDGDEDYAGLREEDQDEFSKMIDRLRGSWRRPVGGKSVGE